MGRSRVLRRGKQDPQSVSQSPAETLAALEWRARELGRSGLRGAKANKKPTTTNEMAGNETRPRRLCVVLANRRLR